MMDVTNAVLTMHLRDPPIIHWDLKVHNILVSDDGNYKLIDFGSCTKEVYHSITPDVIHIVEADIYRNTL